MSERSEIAEAEGAWPTVRLTAVTTPSTGAEIAVAVTAVLAVDTDAAAVDTWLLAWVTCACACASWASLAEDVSEEFWAEARLVLSVAIADWSRATACCAWATARAFCAVGLAAYAV